MLIFYTERVPKPLDGHRSKLMGPLTRQAARPGDRRGGVTIPYGDHGGEPGRLQLPTMDIRFVLLPTDEAYVRQSLKFTPRRNTGPRKSNVLPKRTLLTMIGGTSGARIV